MTSKSSEENLLMQDFSNSKAIEEHELYRFVPRPIPLIPKNKYTDDLPRSYFVML